MKSWRILWWMLRTLVAAGIVGVSRRIAPREFALAHYELEMKLLARNPPERPDTEGGRP